MIALDLESPIWGYCSKIILMHRNLDYLNPKNWDTILQDEFPGIKIVWNNGIVVRHP
jgi:hypothetical protein